MVSNLLLQVIFLFPTSGPLFGYFTIVTVLHCTVGPLLRVFFPIVNLHDATSHQHKKKKKKNHLKLNDPNYLPTGFIITRKFLKYADRNLILQLSFILMIHTFASKVSIMISFVNTLLSIKAPNSSVNCYRCHYEGSELK